MKCPSCHFAMPEEAEACDCGWRRPKKSPEDLRREQNAANLAATRARAANAHPTHTPQSWYNCCKFFPAIARRTSEITGRPLADVGPDNPLDATAKSGFIFRFEEKTLMAQREPGEETPRQCTAEEYRRIRG